MPSRAICDGWRLEKGAPIRSEAFGEQGESLQYGLGYPVTVWPIELTHVSWETAPFAIPMCPPQGTAALLRMQFSCKDGLRWDDLALDKLRLHLSGQPQLMAGLYELLFNRCLGGAFLAPDLGPDADTFKPPLSMSAEEMLFQVGLDVEDGLLPFPPESFLGYRLLMELLSFPQKFLFADLAGWSSCADAVSAARWKCCCFSAILRRTLNGACPPRISCQLAGGERFSQERGAN